MIKKKYKEFKLALLTGGLMEDPSFHVNIDTIRTIKSDNLRNAKQKWAEITKHNDPEYWDEEQQTYWGCKVVEV